VGGHVTAAKAAVLRKIAGERELAHLGLLERLGRILDAAHDEEREHGGR
jgi:hypothetical protein